LWKRIETRALNVCQSRLFPEYAEESEEDKAPIRTHEAEYEPGDQLFMTRILSDSTVEDLHATSMTSQKLAEGACRSVEAQKEPFVLPNCVRGFESIFAKEDLDVLPEHRQWDHAIELILGLEPKSSKVYPLSVTNFIRPYLHQFFDDSHGLNSYGKPLTRPFDQY